MYSVVQKNAVNLIGTPPIGQISIYMHLIKFILLHCQFFSPFFILGFCCLKPQTGGRFLKALNDLAGVC